MVRLHLQDGSRGSGNKARAVGDMGTKERGNGRETQSTRVDLALVENTRLSSIGVCVETGAQGGKCINKHDQEGNERKNSNPDAAEKTTRALLYFGDITNSSNSNIAVHILILGHIAKLNVDVLIGH